MDANVTLYNTISLFLITKNIWTQAVDIEILKKTN